MPSSTKKCFSVKTTLKLAVVVLKISTEIYTTAQQCCTKQTFNQTTKQNPSPKLRAATSEKAESAH